MVELAVSTPASRRHWPQLDPWGWAMVVVTIAASVIIIVPPAVVLLLSFREGRPIDPGQAYSFVHYIAVFGDPFIYRVLLNTLGVALVTLVIALAFGVPAAWLVERTDLRGKGLVLTLMTLGLLIPGFAAAMGWLFLMHPRIGLFNRWPRRSSASPPALQHCQHSRHGLGAGPQPCADRVHHDGRRVARDRSDARGGRRRFAGAACPGSCAA